MNCITQLKATPIQWLDDESDNEEHNYEFMPRCKAPYPKASVKFGFKAVFNVSILTPQRNGDGDESDSDHVNVDFVCSNNACSRGTSLELNHIDFNLGHDELDVASDDESEGQRCEADDQHKDKGECGRKKQSQLTFDKVGRMKSSDMSILSTLGQTISKSLSV